MRTIRPSSPLIPIAVLALLLTACAGGAASASSAPAAGAAAAEADDQDAGNLSGVGEAPRPAPSAAGDQSSDGVGAPIDDARIIRTGTIDLEVTDVPTALRTARDGIRALGGYIGASNTSNDGERPIATITYRVPANRWEDALDLLRGLNGLTSKVVGEQTQAVEVTGQVIDLEARIRNLRASEAALQEIASKAVRVSDVLEVQDQLTQVRGQIEQLTAQLADLEDRAAYATLTATMGAPVVAVTVAREAWEPATVIDEALASLVSLLQALATVGIWLALVLLPVVLLVGAIALAVTWIVRRMRLADRRGDGTMVG